MTVPPARDPRISDVYYYFATCTSLETGRTFGRKIGVVQEIIIRKHVLTSERLADAILFEAPLQGASGASHKIEFVFAQPARAVEFSSGQSAIIKGITTTFLGEKNGRARFRFASQDETAISALRLHAGPAGKIQTWFQHAGTYVKLSRHNAGIARLSVLNVADIRASVESKRVGAQRFSGTGKLGSGIQTIEKAKQASLVAIDADIRFNGTIKALAPAGATRRYVSVGVLGNGVHWTTNDKRVLATYVDYTFLVPDSTIIRYAEYVRALADAKGEPFCAYFMSYFEGMTKTPSDTFAVSDADFTIVVPSTETRTLVNILETQISPYVVDRATV